MFAPVKRALIAGLQKVLLEDRYSDKVLEGIFKDNKKFGARDRRELAETLYGVVRHIRRLAAAANTKEDFELLIETFEKTNSAKDIPKDSMPKAEWYSVSDEFYETLVAEIGEATAEKYLEAMNVQAPVFLRTNTLLTDRPKLIKKLQAEEVKVAQVPNTENALVLTERKNVFILESFKQGFFEVQDVGSQEIALLVDPKPGERVIDACAGAGGKTLHLAALMKNKGRIFSLDVNEYKLAELKVRTRRAKVDIVETKVIDSTKVIKRLKDSADKVLLDVPCTGSGVLRRNPDTKLRFSKEELQRLRMIQQEILQDYSSMVKPGGVLVYSTCSVLPSENEQQIAAFMAKNETKWTVEVQKTLAPTAELSDGFFLCRLVRQG